MVKRIFKFYKGRYFLLVALVFFTHLLHAEKYFLKPLEINSFEVPPPNLLSLFSHSNKMMASIKQRYNELAKQLKLKNVFSDIHNETFFEAYMNGFIDSNRINALTKEILEKIKSDLKQHRSNARFAATFFNHGRPITDLHRQAVIITKDNDKRFNYNTLNNYVIKNKLIEKFFPEYNFIEETLQAHALVYFTHSISTSDTAKLKKITKSFPSKIRKHFSALLQGYSLCEKYWYKSVIKVFQKEPWIILNNQQRSIFSMVNDTWKKIVPRLPDFSQIQAPAISSIAVYPFLNDFYFALISPKDEVAMRRWRKGYLRRQQRIFNGAIKAWDTANNKTIQSNLQTFSENARFLFNTYRPSIVYGFGIPTIALLVDCIVSINKIALYYHFQNRFISSNNKITINYDEFWETGLSLYYTSKIVSQLTKIHPFIEYWFLIKVIHANNMEKYIFATKMLQAMGDHAFDNLKTLPTIVSLFSNKSLIEKIFNYYKLTNPVNTMPRALTINIPEILIDKKGKTFTLTKEEVEKNKKQ